MSDKEKEKFLIMAEKEKKRYDAQVEELEKRLRYTEVSSLVNSIKNQGSDCMSPKKAVEDKEFETGLGRFFTRKRKTMQ